MFRKLLLASNRFFGIWRYRAGPTEAAPATPSPAGEMRQEQAPLPPRSVDTDAPPKSAKAGRFWREMLLIGAILLALFLTLDMMLGASVRHWLALGADVELRSRSMLQLKLDVLRQHKGYRVALLGDSVVLGHALKDHGDQDWQKHEFAALLQRRLEAELPGSDVLVMNLAINGALPKDLALIARELAAAKPDVVICDIGLRAFSTDFSSETTAVSRDWLKTLDDPRLEDRLAQEVSRGWTFYALRDSLQNAAFAGAPVESMRKAQSGAGQWLKPQPVDEELRALQLLILAKGRFDRVRIDADNLQCQALMDLLSTARKERWKFLLFYARENPDVRESLVDASTYARRRAELRDLVAPHLSASLRYHEGETNLPGEHYLDHVHVDAVGYERLVHTLWPEIQALVRQR